MAGHLFLIHQVVGVVCWKKVVSVMCILRASVEKSENDGDLHA